MEIKSYRKGRTEKVLMVTDAGQAGPDDVLNFAMRHAGETPSSLFGHHVRWASNNIAVVTLYTD